MTRGDSTSERIVELEAELAKLRAEREEALADGAMLKALLDDISKRRLAEERLGEAREWLSLAQEAGRVCAYSYLFADGSLHWSDSTLALYGMPAGETATLDRWLAAIHPDDLPAVQAVATAAIERRAPIDHRFRIVLPDGSQRWIQDRGRALVDADGKPTRLVGINIDVTELVELERRAAEDGQRLRLALAAGDNACWDWDLLTNDVTWDDRLSELTGIPNFGGEFEDFWTLVHDEDKPKIRAALDAAIAGEADYAVEFRMVLPDGTTRHTYTQAGVIRDASGRAVRMVGIDTDITHEKAIETALHDSRLFLESILAASPDCVKVIEADGILSYMNDNGIVLMEVPDIAKFLGRRWCDLWPAEHERTIERALAKALRGQTASFEALCPTAAGTMKWWDVSVAPIFGDQGRVDRAVAISRDITDRKMAEEQLQLLNAELHHRVRNTLATLQALARSTIRGSNDLIGFEQVFTARVEALGRTHGLLKAGPAAAELGELVSAELAPFGGAGDERLSLEGPEVQLSSTSAVSIGMILHELTTNASKYGALTGGEGRLIIRWHTDGASVSIDWIEEGLAARNEPRQGGGFGSKLIDRLVRQLRGSIVRRWTDTGLQIELRFPELALRQG